MPDAAPLRVAIYVRVSTADQAEQGVSLDYQEERCRAWAVARGAEVVGVYRDDGASAATAKRREFQRLLHDMRARAFDVIAALKIDRLSRSLVDFCNLVSEAERHDVDLVTVSQQIDTTVPAGRLLRNMLASFAEFEREMIAERTRESMRAAARAGRYCGGRAPFGYRPRPTGDGDPAGLVPDPATRALVPVLFARYLDGANCHDLVRWLRTQGHRLSHSSVVRTLRNPAYLGKQRWAGEIYPSDHEPLVQEDAWNAAQVKLDANGSPDGPRVTKKTRYLYLLDGLVRCGLCGAHCTTSSGSGKRGQTYWYYRCTGSQRCGACEQKPINARALDEFVVEQVLDMTVRPELLADAIAAQATTRAEAIARIEKQRRQVQAERSTAVSSMQRLFDLAAAGEWGSENRSELEAAVNARRLARDSADRRLQALAEELAVLQAPPPEAHDAAHYLAELGERLRTGNPQTRRAWLRSALTRVTLAPDHVTLHVPLLPKTLTANTEDSVRRQSRLAPHVVPGANTVVLRVGYERVRGVGVRMVAGAPGAS